MNNDTPLVQNNIDSIYPQNSNPVIVTTNKRVFNKFIILIILLIILISSSIFLFSYFLTPLKLVKIEFYDAKTQTLKATATAENPAEDFRIKRGLRMRKDIQNNYGIVFKFDHLSKSPYWTKDMLFPIDIIWLQGNKIVDFKQNLKQPFPGQPYESLRLYRPNVEADGAIEVKSGFIKKFNISKGDYIKEIPLK